MKNRQKVAKKVAGKAENVAPKKAVPKVASAARVAADAPIIRARKVGKAESGRVQSTKSEGLMAEVAKIEPIREAKVETQKGAKPAGKTPNGVFASAKQPVLERLLTGKGCTAELIKLAELTAKERKEWKALGLDTCDTPKCGRASVYAVQLTESVGDEDADVEGLCVPCTRTRLGLKK